MTILSFAKTGAALLPVTIATSRRASRSCDRRYYTPFWAAILRCGRDWRGTIMSLTRRSFDLMRSVVVNEVVVTKNSISVEFLVGDGFCGSWPSSEVWRRGRSLRVPAETGLTRLTLPSETSMQRDDRTGDGVRPLGEWRSLGRDSVASPVVVRVSPSRARDACATSCSSRRTISGSFGGRWRSTR